VHAAVRILDAWNPDASNVAVSRLEGVTTAVLSPAGGIVSGQMGAVSLGGDAAALKPYAAMAALGFSAGSRAEDLRFLRELFADARAFPAARAAWERGESREFAAASGDLLALQPVLSGEVPLVVSADRRSDVEAFVRFAEEQRIRIVIDGGAEAWLLRDELARRKIPVIVDPLLFGPSNFETLRARRDNAKLLAEAGVAVLFASHSAHFARKLRQLAGNAVREGMPHAHAMAAITEAPAAAFGLEGRGRIAPGAFADLVLWSGDPLEIGSEVRVLLIGGAELPLRSRQTELLARWRNLPGTPQPIPLPGTE
jgi:imidazolonepropionase-like amidohydrolase